MPQSIEEKRSRFARMFPPRVEKVIDQFRVIGNCSSKSNYDFDRDTVAKVWVHLLNSMMEAADLYGLEIDFKINGKTLSEVAQSGSIKSLFDETQGQGEEQTPLF